MCPEHPFTATDPEEIRARDTFLMLCAQMREEILKDNTHDTTRDKLNLMMFGLLAMIDGVDVNGGPFGLLSRDPVTNREFNISVDLHHHWHKFENLPK